MHPSDFPLPADAPQFPHHTHILRHLEAYANRFGLGPRMHFEHRIDCISRIGEQWLVCGRDASRPFESTFDAVVICTGQHQTPVLPLDGSVFADLKIPYLHTHSYKYANSRFVGAQVLVVGGGESAADVAAEVADVAAHTHLSIRDGAWFQDRVVGAECPADVIFTRHHRPRVTGESFAVAGGRRFLLEAMWGIGGSGVERWKPKSSYLSAPLNKSRDVISKVALRRVSPHRGVRKIKGNLVWFEQEEDPVHIDLIVFATGYRWANEPLEPTTPAMRKGPAAAYRLVFDPHAQRLAFVGGARPVFGSIPALAELQARWVAAVWAGAAPPLPSATAMEEAVSAARAKARVDFPFHYERIPGLVNHFAYSEELAQAIGSAPHMGRIALQRPFLACTLLFSPWTPFQYRLVGPDAAPDLAEAALNDSWPHSGHYAFHLFRKLVIVIDITAIVFVSAGVLFMCYLMWFTPWGFGLL